MTALIVVVVAAALVTLWIRGARANRRQWLSALSLPGTWARQNAASQSVLSLRGSLGEGRYTLREDTGGEEGEWRLLGHTLRLTPDGGEAVDTAIEKVLKRGARTAEFPGRKRAISTSRMGDLIAAETTKLLRSKRFRDS